MTWHGLVYHADDEQLLLRDMERYRQRDEQQQLKDLPGSSGRFTEVCMRMHASEDACMRANSLMNIHSWELFGAFYRMKVDQL